MTLSPSHCAAITASGNSDTIFFAVDLGKRKVILAPMAGITDSVYRSICKRAGADIVVSEMVSAEGIYRKGRNTTRLLHFEEHERPIGIQLFGSNPQRLAYASQYVEEHARPDFIDLNAGCPVPKVIKRNGGAALGRNPGLLEQILTAMVKAVKTPITVKIRSGWQEHQWNDIEQARVAEKCGAAAVTVHPRSKSMGFRGHSYWDRIAAVRQAVRMTVIGSGDIVDAQSGLAMFERTGCDSIMIGRASQGNPWIFSQVKAALSGAPIEPVSVRHRCNMAKDHIRVYRDTHGEQRAKRDMKKTVAWYLKGLPGASEIRRRCFAAQTTIGLEAVLDEYLECILPTDGGTHGTPGAD